jgi:hypothetical protein
LQHDSNHPSPPYAVWSDIIPGFEGYPYTFHAKFKTTNGMLSVLT